MSSYQQEFIEFAIANDVLRFGEFTLKSGRISPYFFNFGQFTSGSSLAKLGNYYAEAIVASGLKFDMLFGPAYKGIPLVSIVAATLFEKHGLDYPFAYNRKEAKDHGEGGQIVGAELSGKVLVVDDVISAGTAIREAADIIIQNGAELGGICISLDRQERGLGEKSAVQEVESQFAIPVIHIAGLDDVINYLNKNSQDAELMDKINEYRKMYAVQAKLFDD